MNPEEKKSAENVQNQKETIEEAEVQAAEKVAEEAAQEEKKELGEEEQLSQKLTDAEEQLAAEQDRYLRLSAEFDNYRKRTLKEKAEIIKNGGERVFTAILPVVDDFERAIANMKKNENPTETLEGIELIYNKFTKILKQEGLEKIETENVDFDTDYHEAIAMIPAPSEDKKGKILDCVQTGYKLGDKVIRHAKVAVGQ